MSDEKPTNKRTYPAFYEKAIPIAIGVMLLAIVGVLIFAIVIALGLL
jgi:hypothetical protein